MKGSFVRSSSGRGWRSTLTGSGSKRFGSPARLLIRVLRRQRRWRAQGALAELASLALAAKDDPDFVQSLQDDWMAMLEKLPRDLLLASPELRPSAGPAVAGPGSRSTSRCPGDGARAQHNGVSI